MAFFSTQPIHRDTAQPASADLDQHAVASLACDVAFISDDSTPAATLIERECQRQPTPQAAGLLRTIHEQLRAVYDGGSFVPHGLCVRSIVQTAVAAAGAGIDADELAALTLFFEHLNGVMFQHQTLGWLSDCEFQVHLYGHGWHEHPSLSRFARGPIESDTMRLAIVRASRINLAASIDGAVNATLTDIISAGGFALLRYCPTDVIERIFPPLHEFCTQHAIASSAVLLEQATPTIRALLNFATHTLGITLGPAIDERAIDEPPTPEPWPGLIETLRDSAAGGYSKSAAAIWPEYPAVSFSSRDELIGMIARFLYDGPERERLADVMRRQLVGRFEHVQVNRRVLSGTPVSSEVAA